MNEDWGVGKQIYGATEVYTFNKLFFPTMVHGDF